MTVCVCSYLPFLFMIKDVGHVTSDAVMVAVYV
jgi:hypothetical protein